MGSGAYYNEIDPHAAQWLRNLIAGGHIAPGDVDERNIRDVRSDDLRGYTQCHFFAGIGVWSYALRRAGWPDDRPVWTGSCPCQPFSSAGKGLGHEDERHLWPTWGRLIGESGIDVVFGEQVANGDGYAWIDLVGHDLEELGYAFGALCPAACGVGAPHIRQRLYFVADAEERGGGAQHRESSSRTGSEKQAGGCGVLGRVVYSVHSGLEGHGRHGGDGHESRRLGADPAGSVAEAGGAVVVGDSSGRGLGVGRDASQQAGGGYPDGSGFDGSGTLADSESTGTRENVGGLRDQHARRAAPSMLARGEVNGFWAGADWVWCRDPSGPRWRPVEPGTFPLAHGVASRVVKLRAYGNAIVAEVAVEFIRAYRETRRC
jgi:DNA (cytosine-5)-methyltransferase 1